MKIVEKIEIKYFRSFSDNPVKIYNLRDINIFSGSNDSGKSNVLRILNLFFNNNVADGKPFNFDRDFSRIQLINIDEMYKDKKKTKEEDKDIRKTTAFIEVKLHFNVPDETRGSLPKKFWISKRWTAFKPEGEWNNNVESTYKFENKQKINEMEIGSKEQQTSIKNTINSLKAQTTKFLHKFEFHYIPAIKDIYFFKELYSELQEKLNQQSSEKIREATENLQGSIREQTGTLFDKFKKSTGLDARFLFEQQMLDFKKNIEVETGEQNILLTSRGDGIQAKFIPNILEEISKSEKNKYIIWGFEEPENSYEYKNSIELAKSFYDKYSINKQIFITTHAREFLSIKDPDDVILSDRRVSIYRVFKAGEGNSKIIHYDDQTGFDKEEVKVLFGKGDKTILEKIYDDLGIIDESRTIAELEKKMETLRLDKERLKQFEIKTGVLAEQLQQEQNANDQLQLEINRERENNKTFIYCENTNKEQFDLLGLTNIYFLKAGNKNHVYSNTQRGCPIYGIMDRDFLSEAEMLFIQSETNTLVLDYYAIENYWYHPDNVESYFISKEQPFDKQTYKDSLYNQFITDWKNNEKFNTDKIVNGRGSYKEIIRKYTEIRGMTVSGNDIISFIDNNIGDFESVYSFYSMKDYCGDIKDGINQLIGNNPKDELSKTPRFVEKMTTKIQQMGITL